jgi:hypothetical protein
VIGQAGVIVPNKKNMVAYSTVQKNPRNTEVQ